MLKNLLNKIQTKLKELDVEPKSKQPTLANAKVKVTMKITRADGTVEYREADGHIEQSNEDNK